MSIEKAWKRSRRHRNKVRNSLINEINVTPFVDVVLVLLIFFMVSTPLLVNGVPLDLPETSADALDVEINPLTVSVTEDGRIAIEEKYYPREKFIAELKTMGEVSNGINPRIIVRGARVASYGQILGIIALIQQAGFNNIALASVPSQGG